MFELWRSLGAPAFSAGAFFSSVSHLAYRADDSETGMMHRRDHVIMDDVAKNPAARLAMVDEGDEMENGDHGQSGWERRRNRRRQRLNESFEKSRRRRHEPPPDPDGWKPEPTWKHVWQTLWDNPLGLLVVAIMIAIVLYILFPPAALAIF